MLSNTDRKVVNQIAEGGLGERPEQRQHRGDQPHRLGGHAQLTAEHVHLRQQRAQRWGHEETGVKDRETVRDVRNYTYWLKNWDSTKKL